MSRKATKPDVENAVSELAKRINRNLAVEFENRRARVIVPCPAHTGSYSVPFGYTFYSYGVLYDMLWFAIRTIDMVNDMTKEN